MFRTRPLYRLFANELRHHFRNKPAVYSAISILAPSDNSQRPHAVLAALLTGCTVVVTMTGTSSCEEQSADKETDLPVYTADQVSENDGTDGKPIWMSYGGFVYDVTKFIPNHPGGSEKILQAAGSAIEPFWYTYRQHYASELPVQLMENMIIGKLQEKDQADIDEQLEVLMEEDPYAEEPYRHPDLVVHSDTPMNAEVPATKLTDSYLTPANLFYVRNHHPVPLFRPKDVENYTLLIENGKSSKSIKLKDLKTKYPKVEKIVTLQCSGNRRRDFNAVERTSGTPWGQGAISTAKFGGVRLCDLLGDDVDPDYHVTFYGRDGMVTSIPVSKALNKYGDCMVAYEMNGSDITRDHGFPLRLIVPGYAAVRSVKWLEKIEVSKEEANSVWQKGLNYKVLPPSIADVSAVDLKHMPSVMETAVYSGITSVHKTEKSVKVGGWAFAGGGRHVVRVDVTTDEGQTWVTAKITEGSDQPWGRAWAWVFWECELPKHMDKDILHVASKAVDSSFNTQPEVCQHTWNVRGLNNNSWYRVRLR